MTKPPCSQDCVRRCVGCHIKGNCLQYDTWVDLHHQEKMFEKQKREESFGQEFSLKSLVIYRRVTSAKKRNIL